jgi:drug/metabolite transporter (DMT)-like permease
MEAKFGPYPLALYCLPLILGTVLSSWGNIQIKLDTIHAPTRKARNVFVARKYLLSGILLGTLGALLDLSVISNIPVTIRAGLASLSIPISVILARLLLDEHISPSQALGVTLAIVGPFVSVLYASHDTSNKRADDWRYSLASERFQLFLLGFLSAFAIALSRLGVDLSDKSRNTILSLVACAFACAFVGFASNASSRFMVHSATHKGLWQGEFFSLLGITILICLCQIMAMSRFLSLYAASVALPLYQVLNSFIFTLGALIIFEETIQSISGYVGGMTVAFLGLWVIATQSTRTNHRCDEPLIDVSIDEKHYNTFSR